MSLLTDSPAWQALSRHRQEIAEVHMRSLFGRDPQRFERFSLRLGDILFDYSKNRITQETISLLIELARQADLAAKIEAMFSGEKINTTESRAVLHVALRNRANRPIRVDGEDVMPEVNRVLAKMRRFSDAVRSGDLRGYTGKAITDVVLIKTPSGELRAFSAVCTHLSCTVQFRPDIENIWCACHNGHYDLNGRNISGPPPRPLDSYNVNVRGDQIIVSVKT